MLYRKYRPQTFAEVIGQDHVIKTLRGALTTGRIGHAYLFCGPRGTGKTTIARLLAKALSCEKRTREGDCDDSCRNCTAIKDGRSLDLIEIDAASNRGIDEVRNLKESALVAAPGGGFKVFIIDEVHMLTTPAFNALLKILEEPPAHVVFILATTEPHKIIPTVLSRVQRFDFKRLSSAQILEKLLGIAKQEKINIDKEGLTAIDVSSGGALRDAEVALSKIKAANPPDAKITADKVVSLLGLIPFSYHPEFLGHILNGNKAEAIGLINKIYESGIDSEYFASEFIDYLRKILMFKVNPATLVSIGEGLIDSETKLIASYAGVLDPQKLIKIITVFVSARDTIKSSPIPQLPLELAVLELLQ